MCDTLVAVPAMTRNGEMMLAKNSDREPNEAQNVTFVPAKDYPAGSAVRCTYIEIPQVRHTFAALLSRPFWMFGAEMGVNERGVAIGNEAVFTKEEYARTGLTGMDMIRLALERAATAWEAVSVITGLIGAYGQGGNGGYRARLYYHNSFIIADPSDAYILETAGEYWAVRQVHDLASISNRLSIGDEYDHASPGVEEYATARGYTRQGESFHFADAFSDRLYTFFGKGAVRSACSYSLLESKKGELTSADLMAFLRDHNGPDPYRPGKKPMERLCLHAGGLVSSQTTGSMVALLRKKKPPLVYFTGTSAPCVSIFKPHLVVNDAAMFGAFPRATTLPDGSIDLYGSAAGEYDADSLWWTGEEIHRRVLMNYPSLAPELIKARDVIEGAMIADIEPKWRKSASKKLMDWCADHCRTFYSLHREVALDMKGRFAKTKANAPLWYRIQWRRFNRKANFRI